MSIRSNRGLDLTRWDDLSEEEAAAFRAAYGGTHGKALAAYEFWLTFNPPVVKRHRLQAFWTPDPETPAFPALQVLGFLYQYTVLGYAEGVRYETSHAKDLGLPAVAVLQIFELAFMRSGPRGMDVAWQSAAPLLETFPDQGHNAADLSAFFPPGWARDPDRFDCGCLPPDPDLSSEEAARVRQWYTDVRGHVPPGVELLIRCRPGLLKAHHIRLSAAMRGPLPAQMWPYCEIQTGAAEGNGAAVRASIEVAHGLGASVSQVVEAAAWGIQYSGTEAFDSVTAAVAAVYDDFSG